MPPVADDLLVEDRGFVRLLTLNRPEHANSITVAMVRRLIDAVAAAAADPQVRVLAITGAGQRTFSGGADLAEMAEETALSRPYQPIMPTLYEALINLEKPTLAIINGTAAGGGLELALACDLRLAAAGSKIGLPEIHHGLSATFGCIMLMRTLPGPVALEMLFTGDLIPVEEAARWGLVEVVPPDGLEVRARELGERVAAAAPLAVRKLKAIARQTATLPIVDALQLQVGPDLYASEDRMEGLRAWREKRTPVWKGR
jgi:enoyl-CoA hydratase